jgi:hypothetical protein
LGFSDFGLLRREYMWIPADSNTRIKMKIEESVALLTSKTFLLRNFESANKYFFENNILSKFV